MDAATGYDVEAASNSLLRAAEERGITVSPMKLQKLLYLMHGYYTAATGHPLINEGFQAWDYGPVSPTVYHEVKQFGKDAIKRGFRLTKLEPVSFEYVHPMLPAGDAAAAWVMNYILDAYGAKTAMYLSELTHKVGSPWEIVKSKFPKMRNVSIDDEVIREYFSNFIKPKTSAA